MQFSEKKSTVSLSENFRNSTSEDISGTNTVQNFSLEVPHITAFAVQSNEKTAIARFISYKNVFKMMSDFTEFDAGIQTVFRENPGSKKFRYKNRALNSYIQTANS